MNMLKVVVLLCSTANPDSCLPFEEMVQATNPSFCLVNVAEMITHALEEHPSYVVKRISCQRP